MFVAPLKAGAVPSLAPLKSLGGMPAGSVKSTALLSNVSIYPILEDGEPRVQ